MTKIKKHGLDKSHIAAIESLCSFKRGQSEITLYSQSQGPFVSDMI